MTEPAMKPIIAILLLIPCSAGCQRILHELQPHRLSRLNYTDASGRSDGSFLSIDDPLEIPVAEPAESVDVQEADLEKSDTEG